MSKLRFLILSSAMGLLCASSPAALAQAALQGGSKSSVDQSKAAFSIPKGGFFKYRGKSPFGDILDMDVTWKTSQHQPKAESMRIGGDVKYKNPKTGLIDSLVIDENRSYITKTGELHFALHAFGDKAFGPVELAALERARLAKSDKPSEKNENGLGASEKVAAPSKTKNSDPSMDSGAPSTGLNKQVAQEDSDTSNTKSTSAINARCKFINATAYDDRFKASGSFNFGDDTFHWKQQKSTTTFNDRRILVRRAKDCAFGGAADQFKSIINDEGKVRAYIQGKSIASNESFYSNQFQLLVKATNQIKKENNHIVKHGLKSLPSAHKNRWQQVTATDGTVMLGALIIKLGAKKVAKQQGTTAAKTYNHINTHLKAKGVGRHVHFMAKHAGLKVKVHSKHGRMLDEGYVSGSDDDRVTDGNAANLEEIAAVGPLPPWHDRLVALVNEPGYDNLPRERRNARAFAIVRDGMNTNADRNRYAEQIADFVLREVLLQRGTTQAARHEFRLTVRDLARLNNREARAANGLWNYEAELNVLENRVNTTFPGNRLGTPAVMELLQLFPGMENDAGTIREQVARQLLQVERARDELRRIRQDHEIQQLTDVELSRALLLAIMILFFPVTGV